MSSSTQDKVSGRAKEATGVVVDDDELKHEGRREKRAGKFKEGVERAVDEVKDSFDSHDEKSRRKSSKHRP